LPALLKIAAGGILLLKLFGAELRLNFGLRFDSLITLAGIWIFWHHCLRAETGISRDQP